MAPVLKTGRAQVLVGSNPTPSASSILDFGLKGRPRAVALRYGRIADLRQKKIAAINAALRQSRRRRRRTDNARRRANIRENAISAGNRTAQGRRPRLQRAF